MTGHDERPGGNRGASSEQVGRTEGQFTSGRRQVPTWHAVAKAVYVTARSGRGRYLLLWKCHACRRSHVSTVRVLEESLTRTAACDGQRVQLHVAGVREAAA